MGTVEISNGKLLISTDSRDHIPTVACWRAELVLVRLKTGNYYVYKDALNSMSSSVVDQIEFKKIRTKYLLKENNHEQARN